MRPSNWGRPGLRRRKLSTVIKFIDKKENVKRLISYYKADNSSRQKGQKSEGK